VIGKTEKRRSLSTSLTLLVAVMIFIGSASVGILAYFMYKTDTIEMHSQKGLTIATAIATAIDGDSMAEALRSGVKDEQWPFIKDLADREATKNNVKYLYIMGADYSSGYFTYYVEGWNPETGDEPLDFLHQETIDVHAAEALETIRTGNPMLTGLYDSSGTGLDFGMLVTGYAPILNSAGEVVGIAGADFSMEEALANVNEFAIRTAILVSICIIVFIFVIYRFIDARVRKPVNLVIAAAEKLALGDPDTSVSYDEYKAQNRKDVNDEIYALFMSFTRMTESLADQIAVLKRVSEGDLSVNIEQRSERDELSFAISATVVNLRQMLELFNKSVESLEASAMRIAEESSQVSRDANEEITVIGGINTSTSLILKDSEKNASAAKKANEVITEMAVMAREGSVQMGQLVRAVDAIEQSFASITKIVGSIDDISFQTNILALNAAVEAARAGQYGKGFAVVADEVRNLAEKSSASARSTGEMIENALLQVSTGVEVANETAKTFEAIVQKIGDSNEMLEQISFASGKQIENITQINSDIERMSEMIHSLAASADSSASVSDSLSERAKQLGVILEKYKLK